MRLAKPEITTIIPTYKRPKLLTRAIEGVLNQTYSNFQICIYDNASGDETAEVVSKFLKKDKRVKYYCHNKNIGAGNNFLFGLKRITSEFFNFLSDDDVILPEFFETAIDGFQRYPEAMFFAGSTFTIRDTGQIFHIPLAAWGREGLYNPPEGLLNLCNGNHPTWTGILFRKDVLKKIGMLDFDTKRAGDLDYELRVAARYPFIISKKPCALFVSHADSSCKLENANDALEGWPKMISNLINYQKIPFDIKEKIESNLWEFMRKRLFVLGIHEIDRKQFNDVCNTIEILGNNPLLCDRYHVNILKLITIICKYISPAYLIYKYSYKLFRYIKQLLFNVSNSEYKELKKYL